MGHTSFLIYFIRNKAMQLGMMIHVRRQRQVDRVEASLVHRVSHIVRLCLKTKQPIQNEVLASTTGKHKPKAFLGLEGSISWSRVRVASLSPSNDYRTYREFHFKE